MSKAFQWVTPDVTVIDAPDGSVILENNLPLAGYPANLVTWLHQHAQNSRINYFYNSVMNKSSGGG